MHKKAGTVYKNKRAVPQTGLLSLQSPSVRFFASELHRNQVFSTTTVLYVERPRVINVIFLLLVNFSAASPRCHGLNICGGDGGRQQAEHL